MSKIIIALAGFLFFISAAAESFKDAAVVKFDALCMPAKSLVETSEEFGEIPMMRGTGIRVIDKDLTVENSTVVFANPKSWSWTIWERVNEDIYCIVAIGKGLEPVTPEQREKFQGKGRSGS